METQKDNLKFWLDINGFYATKIKENEYLLDVCDGFDYDHYPVFCNDENLEEMKKKYNQNMQSITNIFVIEEILKTI